VLGNPHILSRADIDATLEQFADYGIQSDAPPCAA
jgi:hypothetical protein